MKKSIFILIAMILALTLTSCSNEPTEQTATDAFSVTVVCESEDIYQIFYSCYIDDEYYGMGGMADLDGGEITADTDLTLSFTSSFLGEDADITKFSIDFSPYGKDDTSEIATTNRVYIDAEYGENYTIIFSGDKDSGFTAELQ